MWRLVQAADIGGVRPALPIAGETGQAPISTMKVYGRCIGGQECPPHTIYLSSTYFPPLVNRMTRFMTTSIRS